MTSRNRRSANKHSLPLSPHPQRPLQALVVMAALASPARAFLQASSSTLRRYTAPSRESTVFPTLAAARRRYSTQPGRSLLPLSATDRAEDAARAAEDASRKAAVMALKLVNRAISAGGSEATKASYDEPDDFGQEDFLRSIMTAASATTRLALESLQRDAAGLAAEGVGGRDSMDGLDWREVNIDIFRTCVFVYVCVCITPPLPPIPPLLSSVTEKASCAPKSSLRPYYLPIKFAFPGKS